MNNIYTLKYINTNHSFVKKNIAINAYKIKVFLVYTKKLKKIKKSC